MTNSYHGLVTLWSSVSGYGFVRSEQALGRLTIYRDSFLGRIDEVTLVRRMVRFNVEDISGDVLTRLELIPTRERTWSERVQESPAEVTEGDTNKDNETINDPKDEKNVKRNHSVTQTLSRKNSSSQDGGLSLLDLPPYYFKGIIVTLKKTEGYLFIRSDQVVGDVFVSIEKVDLKGTKEDDLLGKTVHFTVTDCGKKSLEASDLMLVDESVAPSVVAGRIAAWDSGLGEGWVELEASEKRIKFVRDKLEVSRRNQTKAMVGRKVLVKLMVDRHLDVEIKSVKMIKTSTVSLQPCPEANPYQGIGPGVLSIIPTMDMEALVTMFDHHLKLSLLSMIKEQEVSDIVLAVIRREVQLSGQTLIQDKVTRMVSSKVSTMVNDMFGCELLTTCLKIFSEKNKRLLVEQLDCITETREQLLNTWQICPSLFISALPYMEEEVMTNIVTILSGQFTLLATNIRFASPLCSFLTTIGNTNLAWQVFEEVKDKLVKLASDKFGHLTVTAFLEHGLTDIKEEVVKALSYNVVELSRDPYGHIVIMSSIKNTSDQYQLIIMENICKVSDNKADTHMVRLVGDKYGHKVVLLMLELSRYRQIHDTIRTAILVKQEEVMDTDYGRVVLDIMRTKFRGN